MDSAELIRIYHEDGVEAALRVIASGLFGDPPRAPLNPGDLVTPAADTTTPQG